MYPFIKDSTEKKIRNLNATQNYGPHRSQEKTVQINKHMIIIILIKRKLNPLSTV